MAPEMGLKNRALLLLLLTKRKFCTDNFAMTDLVMVRSVQGNQYKALNVYPSKSYCKQLHHN